MKDVKKIHDWNSWIRRGVLLVIVGAAVMLACGKTQPVASDLPRLRLSLFALMNARRVNVLLKRMRRRWKG